MSILVIVESPAKAKTISRILGPDYDVQASFGHVRDLPQSADQIPAELKKEKWTKLGVNVEKDFEPLYIVPADKKRHVDNLKKSAKGADQLLLATDEDREGESISWHILELLKPPKKTPVKRIVFHEITPEAILEAIRQPRELDENLVKAQETRRILDRLFGYTLSPLLWKKVAPKLSAGRVQSPAVRLCVERERQRMRFVTSEYWGLSALLGSGKSQFKAELSRCDDQKLAKGVSFDSETGALKDKSLWLKEEPARSLRDEAAVAKPWRVLSLDKKPGQEQPPVPFMTSSLQQEANRKLKWSAKKTMQVAQGLYEGIDLRGERVGLITYMRTDSLNLAERALTQAREVIRDLYGAEYLPNSPVRYRTKAKGAQEAHEAIRPTDLARRPQDVATYLDRDQQALYDLIWKRTLACQMLPAKVMRSTVEIEVKAAGKNLVFTSSGKEIVFPGFLRAYVEGSDDPESDLSDRETVLPSMKEGQELDLISVDAQGHTTKPPARYTEASLIKNLEEEGVGRPSTYSSIISTIQDRGYVFKKGNELIPTWTAFAVTELLEQNFLSLVDLKFTAEMEAELDDIADGKRDWVKHLRGFYSGDAGLAHRVETEGKDIPFPAMALGDDLEGNPVVVRVGRYGTFVQRGEGGKGHTANVPEEMAPADLNLSLALEMIDNKASGPAALGLDPQTGRNVFYRKGRFGDYLEVEQTEEEIAAAEKPRRVTLPKDVKGNALSAEDLALLIQFPKNIGNHPDTGEPIMVQIGQYGPYVKSGTDIRNVEGWRAAAVLTLQNAVELLSQPKYRNARGAGATPNIEPIKTLGEIPGCAGPVRVMAGRYGPYVTDGKTNATIPKGTTPDDITAEEALQLILARAGIPKTKKKFVKGKK